MSSPDTRFEIKLTDFIKIISVEWIGDLPARKMDEIELLFSQDLELTNFNQKGRKIGKIQI